VAVASSDAIAESGRGFCHVIRVGIVGRSAVACLRCMTKCSSLRRGRFPNVWKLESAPYAGSFTWSLRIRRLEVANRSPDPNPRRESWERFARAHAQVTSCRCTSRCRDSRCRWQTKATQRGRYSLFVASRRGFTTTASKGHARRYRRVGTRSTVENALDGTGPRRQALDIVIAPPDAANRDVFLRAIARS